MNIGLSIKKMRKKKGVNQQSLSEITQITQTYLSLIENGRKTPSIAVLRQISDALKVPLPVIIWNSIEENDVAIEKIQAFRALKLNVDQLLNDFLVS